MSKSIELAGRGARRQGRALHPAPIYAQVALLLFFTLFPVFWLLQMSLKVETEAFQMPPKLLFVPILDNYIALFQGKFARSFDNSLIVSVTTTLVSLFLGVPAAYVLSRACFRTEKSIALWILTTRMAPPSPLPSPSSWLIGTRDSSTPSSAS